MIKVGDKIVYFGAAGYSDFTKHKDPERKYRYDQRHKRNENWTKSGMQTPGFWAKWILWNKPTLAESIQDVQRRFHIKVAQGRLK